MIDIDTLLPAPRASSVNTHATAAETEQRAGGGLPEAFARTLDGLLAGSARRPVTSHAARANAAHANAADAAGDVAIGTTEEPPPPRDRRDAETSTEASADLTADLERLVGVVARLIAREVPELAAKVSPDRLRQLIHDDAEPTAAADSELRSVTDPATTIVALVRSVIAAIRADSADLAPDAQERADAATARLEASLDVVSPATRQPPTVTTPEPATPARTEAVHRVPSTAAARSDQVDDGPGRAAREAAPTDRSRSVAPAGDSTATPPAADSAAPAAGSAAAITPPGDIEASRTPSNILWHTPTNTLIDGLIGRASGSPTATPATTTDSAAPARASFAAMPNQPRADAASEHPGVVRSDHPGHAAPTAADRPTPTVPPAAVPVPSRPNSALAGFTAATLDGAGEKAAAARPQAVAPSAPAASLQPADRAPAGARANEASQVGARIRTETPGHAAQPQLATDGPVEERAPTRLPTADVPPFAEPARRPAAAAPTTVRAAINPEPHGLAPARPLARATAEGTPAADAPAPQFASLRPSPAGDLATTPPAGHPEAEKGSPIHTLGAPGRATAPDLGPTHPFAAATPASTRAPSTPVVQAPTATAPDSAAPERPAALDAGPQDHGRPPLATKVRSPLAPLASHASLATLTDPPVDAAPRPTLTPTTAPGTEAAPRPGQLAPWATAEARVDAVPVRPAPAGAIGATPTATVAPATEGREPTASTHAAAAADGRQQPGPASRPIPATPATAATDTAPATPATAATDAATATPATAATDAANAASATTARPSPAASEPTEPANPTPAATNGEPVAPDARPPEAGRRAPEAHPTDPSPPPADGGPQAAESRATLNTRSARADGSAGLGAADHTGSAEATTESTPALPGAIDRPTSNRPPEAAPQRAAAPSEGLSAERGEDQPDDPPASDIGRAFSRVVYGRDSRLWLGASGRELRVALQPPGLGDLRVHSRLDDGILETALRADLPETSQALRDRIGTLEASLNASTPSIEHRLEVTTGLGGWRDGGTGADSGDPESERERPRRDSAPASPSAAHRAVSDPHRAPRLLDLTA